MLLLFSGNLYARTGTDSLEALLKNFEYYSLKKSASLLFVHFDKTVYTKNEQVWFSGYMLSPNQEGVNHEALSVVLIRDANHQIIMQDKFAMASGLAFGNILLSDSIAPGNYHFIAYTNVLNKEGKPLDVFSQAITIKAPTEQTFNATMRVLDTANRFVGPLSVLVNVRYKDDRPINNARLTYTLGNEKKILVKTDDMGQCIISIPREKLGGDTSSLLQANIRVDKESQNISLGLPVVKSAIKIGFYPEGGNLAAGLTNTIGWEAKTILGQPLKLTAVLYKDDKPFETINTSAYGIGRFKILPLTGSKYYIKLKTNIPGADSVYALPQALPGKIQLSVVNALCADSVRVLLSSALMQSVSVIVHNYTEVFGRTEQRVSKKPTLLKIALTDLPKGLSTITVLDSLERPLAERIFFAHYGPSTGVSITSERQQYNTREKVNLKFKLKRDTSGNRVSGFVSIACVQENRIEKAKQTDIESYIYFNHNLEALPPSPQGRAYNDKAYLEDILLVKGWRKYKWDELLQTTAADTAQANKTLNFTGAVTYYGKPLKKPLSLTLLRDSIAGLVFTDSTGKFELTPRELFVQQDHKVMMITNGKAMENYAISLNDPYLPLNRELSQQQKFVTVAYSSTEQSTEALKLNGFENAINLKGVEIRGSSTLNGLNSALKNTCGDYVCSFGILNCPNHPFGGSIPEKNKQYRSVIGGRLETVIYTGCKEVENKHLQILKGIYMAKEFYGSDYAQYSPAEPEYFSTIYWNHGVAINSEEETAISFYASDVTGPFRVIVQGFSDKDLVYGEHSFSVKKP
ncbi:hypothetical protein GCM10023149_45360 [Mucilaginibacter gynuensis]|uniref:MG2 domain-containing protein n=2 Tax=Mucilaginibacter gynuensis TaxID=1302236 RepID=A0ABP8HA47_9SPHI